MSLRYKAIVCYECIDKAGRNVIMYDRAYKRSNPDEFTVVGKTFTIHDRFAHAGLFLAVSGWVLLAVFSLVLLAISVKSSWIG